jgi:hypothetical protein
LLVTLLLVLAPAASLAGPQIVLARYQFDPLEGEPVLPPDLVSGEETLWIVQLQGPIRPAWRADLEQMGVEIHDYLPEFAYLCSLPAGAAATVRSLGFVRWVGAYHPAYKLSSNIGKTRLVDPRRRADPLATLVVQVVGSAWETATTLEQAGYEILDVVEDPFTPRVLLRAPREAAAEIARIPKVVWIEERPDYVLLNNTTRWVIQSNISNYTPIWNHGLHGEGELVTMMDSGLDYNSCWFREQGNAPPGGNHRKVVSYTTWGGGHAYDGCNTGHGTHVAGTAVGDQSYINPGNYNYNGMAYGAKIAVQDVGGDGFLDCLFGLIAPPSSLTSAFNASYNLGSRVHTNSWGSTDNTYDTMARDVDSYMWSHQDALVLFAMGNWGPGSGTIGSPATAKDCISVGATRQAPQQETVASYSSRGPTSDGRTKPTVMAPGGESPTYIYSADNDPDNPPDPTCNVQGNPFQGTSMATPAVAGAALLVRQYYREGWYPSGEAQSGDAFTPSAALIKATLVNCADDMGSADIPNNNEGWGRILLEDALYFQGDTRELRVEDASVGLATGEVDAYSYDVESGEPLEIVLAWSDYPGSTGGGIKLVNDLDLEVEAPGGTVYRGNVFSGGHSVAGGSADRRNTVEVVLLTNPQPGLYTVRVRGYNVPQGGRQPYALVSTGRFAGWPPVGSAEEVSAAVRRPALEVSPNPAAHAVRLRWRLPDRDLGRTLRLEILDVAGRRVVTLWEGPLLQAQGRLSWDGRDARGRPVASGLYWARLHGEGVDLRARILRIR